MLVVSIDETSEAIPVAIACILVCYAVMYHSYKLVIECVVYASVHRYQSIRGLNERVCV